MTEQQLQVGKELLTGTIKRIREAGYHGPLALIVVDDKVARLEDGLNHLLAEINVETATARMMENIPQVPRCE